MSELKEFNIDEFEIGQNLYIEASAGTGKTYTIELLVEKMLQNTIPLSKILIVTFTEKATGELRDRIRKKIISCLEKEPNNSIFTQALQEVGNAQIFTIHSFCQNVLKYYAYETKSSLNLQQVYDNNIDNIVDKFIRDKWKNNKDFQVLLENDCDYSVLKTQFINTINEFNRFAEIDYDNTNLNNDISPIDKFVFEHFKDLIEEWQNYKKNNNLISFADMINLVHDCICAKNDEIATPLSEARPFRTSNDEYKNRLVERLRDAYRYAIIDEFQDTNQKQWDIFSKIFLESKKNNIIVVGDPKQSIFSFQGAEIDVYKEAIKEIDEENGRRLATNYRSSEAMVKACNALFDEEIYIAKESGRSPNRKVEIVKKEDCFFGNSGIVFNESEFPKSEVESKNKKAFLNGNEIEPIWLAEPSDELEYAKYAVSKMVECLKYDENGKTALQIYDKNENQMRSVKFSDFAILARARAEMPYIENEMRKVGIPFYRYKDKTLFDGKECKEWIAILRILDVPDFASYNRKILNQALLTDFFRKKLYEVDCEEFVNPTKKPMSYILEWKKLAEKRRWAELKERIFEDTEIDKYFSSNLLSESFIKICQIGNYIFDYLFNHKVSIEEMIKHLNGLVSKTEGTESEGDLIENANDLDAVRIMTIHSSKGLEFPIVVMVGSLSNYPKNLSKPFVYCKGNKKFLGYDTESKKIEDFKEWRRLIYVAYTRAKYILIIPDFSSRNYMAWKGKGPFSFLTSRMKSIKVRNELEEKNKLIRNRDNNWVEGQKNGCSYEIKLNLNEIVKDFIEKNKKEEISISTKEEAEKQIKDLQTTLPNLKTYQLSYSSISSNLKGKYEKYSSLEQPSLRAEEAPPRMVGELDFAKQKTEGADCEAIRGVAIQNLDSFSEEMAISEDLGRLDKEDSIDDDLNENESFILEKFKNIDNPENIIKACSNYSSNINSENDSTDNYPKGSRLGNAIHEIFELIRFENFGKLDEKDIYNNPELNNLIIEHFEKHSLPIKTNNNWVNKSIQIVLNTLNADLPVIQGSEVIESKTFKLKSLPDNARKSEMEFLFGMDGLEAKTLKNLCKGFIDLLFVRKENGIDYYSILDWKSDYMSEESYSDGEALAEKVAEDYTVQRVLYSYLLIKWLKQFYSGLSEEEIFKQHFGGIYYAFVRGCKADCSNGIYAQTWKSYKALEESYRKLVAELGIRS